MRESTLICLPAIVAGAVAGVVCAVAGEWPVVALCALWVLSMLVLDRAIKWAGY